MTAHRKFDLVLWGATGFTGSLTARYLARHGGAHLRWALAGRDLDKLAALRGQLTVINPALAGLPLLQAQLNDADALRRMASASKVVIAAAGPYIRYGEPVVSACVTCGTDYVDLCGEPEFVDLVWLHYHELARLSGARIVQCCGFDSIPHDLGVWFTVRQLPEEVPLRVQGHVRVSGQFSGGTLQSALLALSRLGDYAQLRQLRRQREGAPVDRNVGQLPARLRYSRKLGSWLLPLPTIDSQVVRRSASADERYGPDFRYGHYLQVDRLSSVAKLVGIVGATTVAAQLPPLRQRLLAMKQAGTGPSEDERGQSWFRVRFFGNGGGRQVTTEVSGGDPGYGETSKMLAESALCLAFDRLPRRAGCLTPATAMGSALIDRLMQAGIQFRLLETRAANGNSHEVLA